MEHGSCRASRYEPGREHAWHLSVLSGQGVSAWAAHATDDGEPVAMAWGGNDDALDDPLLPAHPQSVSFVTLPEWSTLVPDGALTPGSEPLHLALAHGGLPTGAMRDEPVRGLDATCVYTHDDRAERAVLDRWPTARPLPMQGVMVRVAQSRCGEHPLLLLHRGADRMDVAVARDGRILLSNTFPARAAQDTLYFALLAVERTGLTAAGVELRLGGTHLSDQERALLARFFPRTGPACDAPGGLTPTPAGADRWLAALEQFACAS